MRLVSALSSQDYVGLLGESCMCAGRVSECCVPCFDVCLRDTHTISTLSGRADTLHGKSGGGGSLAHEEARQRVYEMLA